MTYVEFFDKVASENICACLTYAPDRVIYIGNNANIMQRHIKNYQKVFRGRACNIEFLYKSVPNNNLSEAVSALLDIVKKYNDCVFDITGGDEIFTLALGIVYSQFKDRIIQIHKFNLKNNRIYDCDKDGITIFRAPPTLSIEENIRIYGGEVAYGSVDEDKTYKWDLNPDFLNDLQLMWNTCKKDIRYWNLQIGIFDAAEKVGSKSKDKLTTVAKRTVLERYLIKHKAEYKVAEEIIHTLLKYRLLTWFEDDEKNVTISYKNEQVKKCLTKAGQALEMRVYLAAKSICEKNGTPVYDDALNGVVIDWDGVLHDERIEKQYDTENEIDIMLMHDVVPVFISCKSGIVTSDELYKLETVAERFGGMYAKKVLVATSIADLGDQGKYLRQRAVDMNIKLVEKEQVLDDLALKNVLMTVWKD